MMKRKTAELDLSVVLTEAAVVYHGKPLLLFFASAN